MSGQPGWLKIALGAGVGFLCGVLLIVVLAVSGSHDGGDRSTATRARTATVERVAVPDVVGLRLDVARERLEGDGFAVERHGGGLLGVVVESNWEVQAQTPTAGTRGDPGATVEVFVDRP
jgi:hypothetical protein